MSKLLQLHELKIPDRNAPREEVARWFMDVGAMDGNLQKALGPYGGIKDVWKNQPCYVIGGGMSLNTILDTAGWEFFRGKHTIGINHVIEDFDGFEWFMFLDRRFLQKTTYDIKKFKGRVFARNTTGLQPTQKITVFKTTNNRVSTKIEDGLYSGNLTGLAALNLAILTGANPIYLCGMGMTGKETARQYHYKPDYTAEDKQQKRVEKFTRTMRFFANFSYYKKRIKVIGTTLHPFQRISFLDHAKIKKPIVEVLGREPVIAHLSFSPRVEEHADITRGIIERCYGRHSIYKFTEIPNADLYILEHFISTRDVIAKFPHKMKAINLVHSMNCFHAGPFLSTIALTNTWAARLKEKGVKAKVIYGGIDLDEYTDRPDYDKAVFGRITRWSPGKIPPWWGELSVKLLNQNKNASCLIFADFVHKRPTPVRHQRIIYDSSVKICDNKNPHLAKLSIYVHANGSFRETMSHAVIEAMATGLPIVYLYEGGVIQEVVREAGIKCRNKDELERELNALIQNPGLREALGKRSIERAKQFHINETVKKFDEEIKRCLKLLQ